MKETLIILAIADLILKHGIPGMISVVTDWGVQDPTIEDIENLRRRVPKPGTYFEVE